MPTPDPIPVGKLVHEARLELETHFGALWVLGEISNVRRQASGHTYCTLKDSDGQISAVAFRGTLTDQEILREGKLVVALGEISVFEARGQLQFIIRHVIEAGAGRLQEAFERLKRKLHAEGLFDPAKKRPLPLLPRQIALVTSPTGAAIRDFVEVCRRLGFRGWLAVVPVRVQGEGAAEEIARAIEAANQLGSFDVVVAMRGGRLAGGSLAV